MSTFKALLDSLQFEQGGNLYFLLLLPGLMFVFFWRLKKSKQKLYNFIDPSCLRVLTNASLKKRGRRLMVFLLSFLFLLVAFSEPVFLQHEEIQQEVQGVEMVLLADLSRSMWVKDMPGGLSRVAVMRKELSHLVDLAGPDSRIGLVGFAGAAELLSPLTRDHTALKLYIEALSVESQPLQGTNFAAAFDTAFRAIQRGSSQDPSVPRVFVIASDGEDHKGIKQTKDLLLKERVRIFAMGVGSAEGGFVPLKKGGGYKKTPEGMLVQSRFQPVSLKQMAHQTGGMFFKISPGGDAVYQITQKIKSFKQGRWYETTSRPHQHGYQVFLFVAFLLGMWGLLMKDKTKTV